MAKIHFLLVKNNNNSITLYSPETHGMETWGMSTQIGIDDRNGKWFLTYWQGGGPWMDDIREENELNVILETENEKELIDYVIKNYPNELDHIITKLNEINKDWNNFCEWWEKAGVINEEN